jgi:hypothetical protein
MFSAQSLYLLIVTLSSTAMAFTVPKNIVVVGGGIQGTSVAYHLLQNAPKDTTITLLEAKEPAAAASGKGGGFMARSWGNGSPTQRLHELAFDLYPSLSQEIGCTSYRKLPVLSVSPGYKGIKEGRKKYGEIMPDWLDGEVGRISPMGMGDDTAQVTPHEFVTKMLESAGDRIKVVLGTCSGVETNQGPGTSRKITAVKYQPRGGKEGEEVLLAADAMVVSAGPWSCAADDWFQGAVELPMEGIKSTSIVWKKPEDAEKVDATALFCGEDDRFGTHCKYQVQPLMACCTVLVCMISPTRYCISHVLSYKSMLQWRYILVPTGPFICVVLVVQSRFPKMSSRPVRFEKSATPARRGPKRRNNRFRACHLSIGRKENWIEPKHACGLVRPMPCRIWARFPDTKVPI